MTIRECLYLGGYKDEELNVIPNEKFPWRTKYITLKHTIQIKLKGYPGAASCGTHRHWQEIQRHVDALADGLEDDQQERARRVFSECGNLLPQFLAAARARASRPASDAPAGARTLRAAKKAKVKKRTASPRKSKRPSSKQPPEPMEFVEVPPEMWMAKANLGYGSDSETSHGVE